MMSEPAGTTARASVANAPFRVWAIATNTFTQLVRMKVFYFLFLFAGAIIAASLVFLSWSFEQELKLLKDVSLGAMALFSGLFAIVGTAILIPKDIEDRTLYTVLSKPVRRLEYLVGKLLGVLLLIAVSLVIMQVLFSVVLYFRQQGILETELGRLRESPPLGLDADDLAELMVEKRDLIESQGLSWNLLNATLSIFLKASVVASVSLFLSTVASSTLFTIISGTAIYIIGHLQGFARTFFLDSGEMSTAIERLLAVVVAIIFPDFKLFDIVDDVAAGVAVPFGVMVKMVGLAAFYVVVYNLAAYLFFSEKEL